jgi:chromate transporter
MKLASAPTQDLTRKNAGGVGEVFVAFLRLGCTSFGGPAAHLGYFQEEFVRRRAWLADDAYAELVALAQALPGPGSSQVGFAIGTVRAGLWGGLAAWLGFTTPSVVLLLAFAFGHSLFRGAAGAAFLHGLQLVAVAVVASAVLTMQRSLAPDRVRLLFMLMATALVLLLPSNASTPLVVALGAVGGLLFLREKELLPPDRIAGVSSRRSGVAAAVVFLLLLAASIVLRSQSLTAGSLFAGFFQAGSLVFGGGHVVLPLLDNIVVARGWVPHDVFVSGYGAAQAVPGPLFTFAAYLGAVVQPSLHPLLYGLVALVAIFAPGLLLMVAILPFWASLRAQPAFAAALRGVNASVVGVLLAALYQAVWPSAVHSSADFLFALCAFVALVAWRVPPWIVVVAAGAISCLRAFV